MIYLHSKSISNFIFSHKIILCLIFILVLAFSLRIWNLGKAGQVWDEKSLLVDYAYRHYYDATHLDFGSDFWWKGTPDHPPLVRYMRIIAALPDLEKIENGKPVYKYDLTYDRLLSVILTTFASGIVFLIGARYLSLYAGLVAGMVFAMMPIPLAHSQIAMLEALALFFFTSSMYSFLRFLEEPTKKHTIIAGIALGFAVLARETHLMLVPMMLLIYFIKNYRIKMKDSKSVLVKIIALFLIGFLTFFALWPMPFFHLDYLYHYTTDLRFKVHTSIPEVFFGRLMLVPIFYYLVEFLITTPLAILILFIFGLIKINKSKKWVWYAFIIWFTFPFIMSFYHERQQGIRYIIQICAPLALIAGLAFDRIVNFFTSKISYKILAIILLFLYQFIILWRITPYYLDYYNILVGGAKGVYENRSFHLAWWGEGIYEAFVFLGTEAPKGATIGIAITPDHITPPLPGRKIVRYTDSKIYDYVVVNFYNIVRIGFDDSKIRRDYRLVYSVMADGAHLVDVYKKK